MVISYKFSSESFDIQEKRLVYNITIPTTEPKNIEDAKQVVTQESQKKLKDLQDKLQKAYTVETRKGILSQMKELKKDGNSPNKYATQLGSIPLNPLLKEEYISALKKLNLTDERLAQLSQDPTFGGGSATIKNIYLKLVFEKGIEKQNGKMVINDTRQMESLMEFAQGGETVVLGNALQGQSLHLNLQTKEKKMREFQTPITIEGYPGLVLDDFHLFNVKGVTIKNLVLKKEKLGSPNAYGVREDRLMKLGNVENITVENVQMHGKPLDIDGFIKTGDVKGILDTHKGLFVQNGKNINITGCSFDNLYHGIEFEQVQNTTISKNTADIIVSDFITGGGMQDSEISNNTLGLRLPVILDAKEKDGKLIKVHSDFAQLYTAGHGKDNKNMQNKNVKIIGNREQNPAEHEVYKKLLQSKKATDKMIGVQGIFVGDEENAKNENITIEGNILYANQYNAITTTQANANIDDIKQNNTVHVYKNPHTGPDTREQSDPRIRYMKSASNTAIKEIKLT